MTDGQEPDAWHCGSCARLPRPTAQGLTRRSLFAAAAVTTAGLSVWRGRPASSAPVVPLTVAAGPRDALSRGTWLAGDTHVHTDHSSDGSATRQGSSQVLPGNVSVADQIGQAQRMGLDFLPITDHRTYDQHWDPLWSSSALLLVPGEEANGRPHATVHGCVDEVVDGAGVPGSHPYRHIQQSIWEVRAQGGTWSTAHPDDGEYDDGAPNPNAEAVGVHLVEVWNRGSSVEAELAYAENRWNAGWRFGGVGGCDCHFRELWGTAGPGMPTTYVLAPERSERGILDALRAGRTSVSSSPLGTFLTLEADLDGDGDYEAVGGDEVAQLTAGTRGVLRVRVQRGTGQTVVVLTAPGRPAGSVFTAPVTADDQTFLVPVRVPDGEGWWRAEVRGYGQPASIDTNAVKAGTLGGTSVADQLQAFVSPVFTSTGAPATPRQRLTLPPPAGGADAGVPVLGDLGQFTGFPDVAVSGKAVHLVAERHLPAGTTVVHAVAPQGHGHPVVETVLTTSRSARFPRVAATDGWVHVVWQDERSGQQPRAGDVYLRSSRDGGRSWGAETRVSTSSGRSERPAVAVDPVDPGRPWVVWTDNRETVDTAPAAAPGAGQHAFDVLVARPGEAPVNLSAVGKTTGPGTPGDTRSARWPASLHPSVTMRPDRGVVVCWQDDRFDPHPLWTGATPPLGSTDGGDQSLPDAWEPMVAVLSPGSRLWSPPVRVAPDAAASARHPQVLSEAGGRLVAVWSDKPLKAADVNLRLRAATSTDGGLTWSPPVTVDPFAAAMSARPRLGRTARGTARVVWSDTRAEDWRWRVRTAVLDGAAWRPAGDLTRLGNGNYPATDGDVVVGVSDRAARLQRDVTQQVVLVDLR